MIRVVDVSAWQHPERLPWSLWHGEPANVGYVVVRSSVALGSDVDYLEHRANAQAAGFPVALYHALIADDTQGRYPPAAQARLMWSKRQPGDDLPLFVAGPHGPIRVPRWWVDLESLAADEQYLADFVNEFERLAPGVLLGIYTSAYFWRAIVGIGSPRWVRYPLWQADYGGYQKPYRKPEKCGLWPTYLIHQYGFSAGWNGYVPLPGYHLPLDLGYLNEDYMPITDAERDAVLAFAGSAIEDLAVAGKANDAVKLKLQGIIKAVAVPVPPPPPPKHTLANLTNQQVINLFSKAFGTGFFPILTAACDEVYMLAHRPELYKGSAVEDMPTLTDAQKGALITAL